MLERMMSVSKHRGPTNSTRAHPSSESRLWRTDRAGERQAIRSYTTNTLATKRRHRVRVATDAAQEARHRIYLTTDRRPMR